jgi:type IV pilus assembly protein PilQ
LEKIDMKRKTKTVPRFFVYSISLLLFAIVILVNGCARIKPTAPDVEISSDTPLTMNAKLLEADVESVKILNPDEAVSVKKISTDQDALKTFGIMNISEIFVSPFDKGIVVSVRSDAPIDEFKTFTIKDSGTEPARIVVDMFRVKSLEKGEIKIPVNNDAVERVRYRGYDDKVRLVIDTEDEYLSSYETQPVENGLDIRVDMVTHKEAKASINEAVASESSTMIAPKAEKTLLMSGPKSGDQRNSPNTGSAVVNRIEFTGLPAGKSSLALATTSPIRYEIKEVADRKIILKLFDTRLPEHQKRPLITNRFESAVDRILPIQTTSMKDSILSIELREKVGYQTSQVDNVLQIRFDESSIPPKPLDEASLPSLRQVMPQTLEETILPTAMISAEESLLTGARRKLSGTEILGTEDVIKPIEPVKRYTGEKIALDFFETDIRNVFRILREVSGKNFAIDGDVTGTVTLTLEQPVPWDQVLDLIMRMNQLGKVEEDDVIRIAKMATITKEQQEKQDQIAAKVRLEEEEKAAEPLITEYFPINYSDANVDILPKLQLLSTKERGVISVDTRTNMIIMTDTAEKIQHAGEIIQRLDMVTPQVVIEARIVEAATSFSREIGIQWFVDADGNDSSSLGGIWGYDAVVNLPPSKRAGSIGFQFSRILGTPLLIDARLSAIETLGEGKIVSAPKVMTLNNKKAVIKQGREIPYSVVDSNGQVNTEFKNVDLLLEVTPHVTPDDRVTLSVLITKDEIAEFSVDGVPSLSTKRAETVLLVNDGETIVIGGILLTNEQKTSDAVPWLSKVPVLKWFFKRDFKSNRKEELLIFLTPKIMRFEQKNILS